MQIRCTNVFTPGKLYSLGRWVRMCWLGALWLPLQPSMAAHGSILQGTPTEHCISYVYHALSGLVPLLGQLGYTDITSQTKSSKPR